MATAQSFEVNHSYVFSFFFLFLVSFSFFVHVYVCIGVFFSWCIFLLISLIFEVHSPLKARGRESRERVAALSVLDPRQVPRGAAAGSPLRPPGSAGREQQAPPTHQRAASRRFFSGPPSAQAREGFCVLPKKGRQVPGTKTCFKIQILLLFRYGRTNRWINNCQ